MAGCVLQLYAILKSGERTYRAIVSVSVSAITTGFNSASISFDKDVDPKKRKESPAFYGYIPDGGSRTVIFGCMMLNSALLLLMRSLSAAMLMLVKKRYFVLYWAGDVALYLLQKVAKGDFRYWIPVDGAMGLLMSLVIRVLGKTIVDFTGLIHFRHPYEMGGLYWTGNMFLALLASFGSVWVYLQSGKDEVREGEAWALVGYMGGAWAITFGLFLLLMKKEYRGTFYTAMSGTQFTMNFFLRGIDDEQKSKVVRCNKPHWVPIRDEVKTWVLGNWWRWVEEKPLWFSEAWVKMVPDDFVPDDVDKAKLAEARRRGRRLSAANVLGGLGGTARIKPVS